MKNAILTAIVSLVSAMTSSAMADGFVCETTDGLYKVKAYNQTQAEAGTRNAAVLVISDASVSMGRKTIARFTDVNISNHGASYLANVDLRFNDSSRKGELFMGTKLGYIDTIQMDVDFTYGQNLADGDELDGMLTINKRNGTVVTADLVCERYLKN